MTGAGGFPSAEMLARLGRHTWRDDNALPSQNKDTTTPGGTKPALEQEGISDAPFERIRLRRLAFCRVGVEKRLELGGCEQVALDTHMAIARLVEHLCTFCVCEAQQRRSQVECP